MTLADFVSFRITLISDRPRPGIYVGQLDLVQCLNAEDRHQFVICSDERDLAIIALLSTRNVQALTRIDGDGAWVMRQNFGPHRDCAYIRRELGWIWRLEVSSLEEEFFGRIAPTA